MKPGIETSIIDADASVNNDLNYRLLITDKSVSQQACSMRLVWFTNLHDLLFLYAWFHINGCFGRFHDLKLGNKRPISEPCQSPRDSAFGLYRKLRRLSAIQIEWT